MSDATIAPEFILSRAEMPATVEQYNDSHQEDALDDALAATFPSSDPIAIAIT